MWHIWHIPPWISTHKLEWLIFLSGGFFSSEQKDLFGHFVMKLILIKIIEGIDYRIYLKVNNIEKSSISMKLSCIFDNFSTNLGYLNKENPNQLGINGNDGKSAHSFQAIHIFIHFKLPFNSDFYGSQSMVIAGVEP